MLVYSISSRRSLETLKSINLKLLNLTGTSNVPRVLVGNKADLEQENLRFVALWLSFSDSPSLVVLSWSLSLCSEVTTAQGQALAAEWGCAFVECSAKIDHNIGSTIPLCSTQLLTRCWLFVADMVFSRLLDEIDKVYEPEPDAGARCGMRVGD